MSAARGWRDERALDGPLQIVEDDIPALNMLFSEAFTERYRKDGMVSVRVPGLNPQMWKYAIADAARGAVLWRTADGDIAAFNLVHVSGTEGWMGPLAVASAYQGRGAGKTVVTHGVGWLKARNARVIGLETMPRTMDNIGFYSSLDFVPGPLTITLSLPSALGATRVVELSRMTEEQRDSAISQCADLLGALCPGYDFTRELRLTHELGLGDTVLSYTGSELRAFALCHSAPLVEGREREEMRVLKLVARDDDAFARIVMELASYARKIGTRTMSVRVQGAYATAYRTLVAQGARIRWTDLRMTAAGYAETVPHSGVVLSNWEI
ncbi:MAG: GNAT family N-acetyltransferase [Gemmatimonadaceae bacterium]